MRACTRASDWASGIVRSISGMFAARPMPWATSCCFTSAMMGPSWMPTSPVSLIASADEVSPSSAAMIWVWLSRSASSQTVANASEATTRSADVRMSERTPSMAGPSRSARASCARGGRSRAASPSKRSVATVSMSTCSSTTVTISVTRNAWKAGSSASGATVATNVSVSVTTFLVHWDTTATGASSTPNAISATARTARQRWRDGGGTVGAASPGRGTVSALAAAADSAASSRARSRAFSSANRASAASVVSASGFPV